MSEATATATAEPDTFLTKRQVARLLHVHPNMVNELANRGKIPHPIRLTRHLLWDRDALLRAVRGGAA